MLATLDLEMVFSLALWLTGIASFCVLGAGIQVPTRFHWKEELARLSPFNRKIVWVYYAFIALTIVGFGALTLVFHDEMLRGDKVALALAAFIGLWWTFRIVIDATVYTHDDWPKGWIFTAGHALLTSTFVAMAGTYLSLVVWKLLAPAGNA